MSNIIFIWYDDDNINEAINGRGRPCYRHAKQQQQQQQQHPSFVYKLKCQQKVDCDALANALLRHLVSHYTKAPCGVVNLGCLWNSGRQKIINQGRPVGGLYGPGMPSSR
jgi:hypothetical protein